MFDDTSIPLIDTNRDSVREKVCIPVSPKQQSLDEDNIENLKSLVFQYSRDGSLENLRTVVDKYPFYDLVNVKDSQNAFTALHYASRYGRVNIVDYLLFKGAQVDAQDEENCTPLHITSKYCRDKKDERERNKDNGDRKGFIMAKAAMIVPKSTPELIIEKLLDKGGDVNALDSYGLTPLHYSAMRGNIDAAKILIRMGANINAKDVNSMTPLRTACVYGSDQLVDILLANGAEISAEDSNDGQKINTVFHIASQYGNVKTLKLLLQKAGKSAPKFLVLENPEGKTPLCLAIEGNHPHTIEMILEKFNEFGIEKWQRSEKYLIHLACSRGYDRVVPILIKYGASLQLQDGRDRLPIHEAAERNRYTVVEWILDQQPGCLEHRDQWGLTPLLLAASSGNSLESVQVLLSYNANLYKRDNDGQSIVFRAAKYNAVRTLEYILTEEEKRKKEKRPVSFDGDDPDDLVNQVDHEQNTAMHIACTNGYLESCKLLYSKGAKLDKLNEDELTPLHYAALRGRNETVRQLLEWDSRLVINRDEKGNTSLHLAAKNGNDVAVKILLDFGSDVESKNSNNETALQIAVAGGHLDCLIQLMYKGAKSDREDSNKDTPLLVAAARGYTDIVRYLLSQGIQSLEHRNKDGMNALELAIEEKQRDCVMILLENRRWHELMYSNEEIKPGRHATVRNTPMRQILKYFPDLAPIIFDKCIFTDNETKNYNYMIEYQFDLIDDTFMVLNKGGSALVGYSGTEDTSAYTKENTVKKEAQTYTQDHDIIYKNHPLKLIAQSNKMSLLAHPLVLALIKYKWNQLGRYAYYSAFSIYMFFILLYTFYVSQTPAPYNVFDGKEHLDMTDHLDLFNSTCDNINVHRPPSMTMVKWMIISLASAQLVKEAFQLYSRRMSYFSKENAIECFIYSSAIVTVMDISNCSSSTGLRMNWQWMVSAVCAFLCWMNLLLMVRKLPRFGIYVVMFFDIVRTFMRFSIIFFLFILAFSISFFIMWQNRPEFSSLGSSIMKTTVMMIGEFEYTAIFHGDEDTHSERLFGHWVAKPLFFIFCIIMTILLMNLLVGLAVDDIQSVMEKAEQRRLVMQVDLVLQVETTIPFARKKISRDLYSYHPNHTSLWKRIRSFFGLKTSTEDEQIYYKSEEQELVEELKMEIKQQNDQVKNLQDNIDVMYEKQLRLESMMKHLLKHNNVAFNENE